MIAFLIEIDEEDDRAFFERMYRDHHKMMFRCAFDILKNKEDAEDALQQVLLHLWRCIGRIKAVSANKLAAYLFITTKNSCLNILKSRGTSVKAVSDEIDLAIVEDTPETIAIKKYDNKILLEAFDDIPVQYRQIIIDKTILDMNDEQIAKHIGIKPTYARECLHRARCTLRKAYNQRVNFQKYSSK